MKKKMAQYMLLFKGGDLQQVYPEPDKQKAYMQRWGIWMQELKEQGALKGGQPLADDGKLITADLAVSDFDPGDRDQWVGGYLRIEAADLDEACTLAKGCPIFDVEGKVEVRAVKEM